MVDITTSKRVEGKEEDEEEKGGRVSKSGHSTSKQRSEVIPASSLP